MFTGDKVSVAPPCKRGSYPARASLGGIIIKKMCIDREFVIKIQNPNNLGVEDVFSLVDSQKLEKVVEFHRRRGNLISFCPRTVVENGDYLL